MKATAPTADVTLVYKYSYHSFDCHNFQFISSIFGCYNPNIYIVMCYIQEVLHWRRWSAESSNALSSCDHAIDNLATSATEAIMIILVTNFLFTLPLGEYLPYWILFTYRQITTLFKIIIRVIYPLVLIYTHSDVRQILKSLLKCGTKFNVNRVTPASNT